MTVRLNKSGPIKWECDIAIIWRGPIKWECDIAIKWESDSTRAVRLCVVFTESNQFLANVITQQD
jgi:hypothetical protein